MLVAIGLLTCLATLLGGALALRWRASIDLLLGFGGGAVVGVALLDLLPEAFILSGSAHTPFVVATTIAGGFAAYLLTDQTIASLTGLGRLRSHMGPATLATHSLVDGANTVTLSLSAGASRRTAWIWLAADALAPLFGIGLSGLIAVPPATLGLLLAVFAGFFCYIGASELVPRARERRPQMTTTFATIVGIAAIYLAVRLS